MTKSTSKKPTPTGPLRARLLSEAERWEALDHRDASYDVLFVLGVVTTGIYCLPSCPARTPKPENIRFFDTVQQARESGFRSCKRCRPEQTLAERKRVLALAQSMIADDQKDFSGLTAAALARQVDLSVARLDRHFQQLLGLSPRAFVDGLKVQRFKAELTESQHSVTQALYEAGYGSSSRIYGQPVPVLGMLPQSYQRGGAGEEIRYVFRKLPEPWSGVLIGATQVGVCFAQLGSDPKVLLGALRDEFPAACCRAAQADAQLQGWLAQLVRCLKGYPDADVPLDVFGTALQIAVWKTLRQMPVGETCSYGALARAAGHEKAVRAVASACGANRIAVLIPCHRVVRGDGSLGGYRWEPRRKQALLDAEAQADRQT